MYARHETGSLTLGIALAITLGAATVPDSLSAQNRQRDRDRSTESWLDDCRDRDWNDDDRDTYCEVKEQRLQPSGTALTVDGRQNGGITVRGWEQGEILVRARIQTWAGSEERARELASEVKIETNGARVSATGPASGRRTSWSVSYEIFVPQRFDLDLETYNGGIHVSDVHGRLALSAHNGGLHLDNVGGDVRGTTTNGGLHVDLNGDKWDGSGLDLRTTNGGVDVSIPHDYSAMLETGTVNGGMSIDFPITVQGRISRRLTAQLGNGGPTIRAVTTNGGVRIRRS